MQLSDALLQPLHLCRCLLTKGLLKFAVDRSMSLVQAHFTFQRHRQRSNPLLESTEGRSIGSPCKTLLTIRSLGLGV